MDIPIANFENQSNATFNLKNTDALKEFKASQQLHLTFFYDQS